MRILQGDSFLWASARNPFGVGPECEGQWESPRVTERTEKSHASGSALPLPWAEICSVTRDAVRSPACSFEPVRRCGTGRYWSRGTFRSRKTFCLFTARDAGNTRGDVGRCGSAHLPSGRLSVATLLHCSLISRGGRPPSQAVSPTAPQETETDVGDGSNARDIGYSRRGVDSDNPEDMSSSSRVG